MRGAGRIFKRANSSSWWIAYCRRGKEIRESAGSEIKEVTRKKKKELTDKEARNVAEKFLERRLKEVWADSNGLKPFVGPNEGRVTIGELLDALEADFRLRQVKSLPQVLAHLKPIRESFGDRLAVQLNSEIIDRFIELRLKDEMAPATINRGTQLLAQAFKLALDRNRLSTAPKVRRLSESGNARQGFFERADFECLVSFLPDYLKDFARFASLSGWRKGEIASLKWADVDMDGRVIRLRPEHSKNGAGRVLSLEGELWDITDRQATKKSYKQPDKTVAFSLFVFHRKGEPVGDIRRAWAKACKSAKCEGRLFHDLRRTSVRNMIRAGVPERIAMGISGHKTRAVFDRYNIVSEDDLRLAMKKTQQYLRDTPVEKKTEEITRAAEGGGR
jgi:integrase